MCCWEGGILRVLKGSNIRELLVDSTVFSQESFQDTDWRLQRGMHSLWRGTLYEPDDQGTGGQGTEREYHGPGQRTGDCGTGQAV